MKKVILIFVSMFIMTSAMAQDEAKEKKEHKRPDRKEMIAKRTQNMVEKYGLSAEQAEKVKALNEKYMARGLQGGQRHRAHNADRPKMDDGQKPQQPKGDAKRKPQGRGGQPNMAEYDKELQSIMTDAQYKAYTADREKRKAEMKERRNKEKN